MLMDQNIIKQKRSPIWIIIAAVFVIIAGTAGGITIANYAGPAKKAARQLELARKYVSELNYEQAIIAYETAIKIDPKNADAYLELADLYLKTGDTDQARKVLDKAVKKVSKSDRDRINDKMAELPAQNQSDLAPEGTGQFNESDDTGDALPQNDEYRPYWSNADNEVHEYNENGYVIKTTAYLPDGSVDHYIIYDCDDYGKLLARTTYSGDGLIYSKEVYNAGGIVIRSENFGEDGSGYIIEYDDAGQLLKQTAYSGPGQVSEYYQYEFFENGSHSVASFHPDGLQKTYEVLDARGRSVVHIIYNDDGSEYIHWEYEYYDDGNEKIIMYENDRIIQIDEIDASGNLVNRTEYPGD